MAQYIKEKIRILRQFNVRLTNEEIQHIKKLKTEIAIDNYVRTLIMSIYGDD